MQVYNTIFDLRYFSDGVLLLLGDTPLAVLHETWHYCGESAQIPWIANILLAWKPASGRVLNYLKGL